jgi:hypothetical protein
MFSLPIFLFPSLVLVVHGLPSTFHRRADQVYYIAADNCNVAIPEKGFTKSAFASEAMKDAINIANGATRWP